MAKEKFHYQVTARVGLNTPVEDFESDNVFKDIAKRMSKIEPNKYPNGCTIKCWDDYGNVETYGLVKARTGGFFFKSYTFDRTNSLEDYIDYNMPPRYLTCLDSATNEYKYYVLYYDKADGTYKADYGRLGQDKGTFQYGSGQSGKDGTHTYSAQMYWIKYYEKIAKGYEDHSEEKDFDHAKVVGGITYAPIPEKEIKRVIEYLVSKQRDYIAENYDLKIATSEKAIANAKNLISQMEILFNRTDINDYSKKLALIDVYKKLLLTVPRRIKDVQSYISRISFDEKIQTANGEEDNPNYIGAILEEERTLIQNFEDVYKYDHANDEEKKLLNKTILEANGLKAFYPTFKEKWMAEDRTRSKNGSGKIEDERHLVSSVLILENTKTKDKYNAAKKELHIDDKDCYLMFHGSRTENWWSIYRNGMSLNPNAIITGKLFGNGLYFAPLARKSLGYTDFRGSCWSHGNSRFGYLALFDVAMGKAYNPSNGNLYNNPKRLMAAGYNSTWAKAGYSGWLKNEECIVYREDQCNIKYLIEMDADRQTFKNFTIENIRKLKCTEPVYDKEKNTITVKCDIDKYVSSASADTQIVFDCEKEYISVINNGNEVSLYGNEKAYITDVYMSNFAESYPKYIEWQEAFKEGRDLNKKTIDATKDDSTPKIVLPITPNAKPDTPRRRVAAADKELFSVSKGIICQQVNCCGMMRTDAGLSGAIYNDYPQVKDAYDDMYKVAKPNRPNHHCQPIQSGAYQVVSLTEAYIPYKSGDDLLNVNYVEPRMMDGGNAVKDKDGLYVANIYGQKKFGNPYKTGEVFTELDKLTAAIKDIAESNPDIPVYIPHSVINGEDVGIGCGYGGEKWENVYKALKGMKLDNIYLLDTNTGKSRKVRLDKDLTR